MAVATVIEEQKKKIEETALNHRQRGHCGCLQAGRR